MSPAHPVPPLPEEKIKTLSSMPSLPALYAAAVSKRPGAQRPGVLPEVAHRVRKVRIDAERAAAFDHLMGGPATNYAHPGVLHVLAFPVAMSLMVRPDFPAAMLGAVHLSNSLLQHRPVMVGELVDVECRARNLKPHRKGMTFEAVSTIHTQDGEIIATDVSTYLVKGSAPGAEAAPAEAGSTRSAAGFTPPGSTARWVLAADTGRRYAEVSGDVNPIHMSKLTAKALGFPQAIAHGMYTASRALTESRPDFSRPLRWDVTFDAPVLLPGTVLVRFEDDDVTGSTRCVGWRPARTSKSGESKPARRHFTVDVTTLV